MKIRKLQNKSGDKQLDDIKFKRMAGGRGHSSQSLVTRIDMVLRGDSSAAQLPRNKKEKILDRSRRIGDLVNLYMTMKEQPIVKEPKAETLSRENSEESQAKQKPMKKQRQRQKQHVTFKFQGEDKEESGPPTESRIPQTQQSIGLRGLATDVILEEREDWQVFEQQERREADLKKKMKQTQKRGIELSEDSILDIPIQTDQNRKNKIQVFKLVESSLLEENGLSFQSLAEAIGIRQQQMDRPVICVIYPNKKVLKLEEKREQPKPVNQTLAQRAEQIKPNQSLRKPTAQLKKPRQVQKSQIINKVFVYTEAQICDRLIDIARPEPLRMSEEFSDVPSTAEAFIAGSAALSKDLRLAVVIVVSISPRLLTRIFDNQGRRSQGRIRIWTFDSGWKCKPGYGTWVETLQRLFGQAMLEQAIKGLTGTPVKIYEVRRNEETLWKLFENRVSQPNAIRQLQKIVCIPKESGSMPKITREKVYFLEEGRKVATEQGPKQLVKLSCEKESLWLKYESFVEQFSRVVIVNSSETMFHAEMTVRKGALFERGVYYFMMSTQENSVGLLNLESRLAVSIYREMEKNKFELEVQLKGTYFSKMYSAGNYLVFMEGLQPTIQYRFFLQISSRPKLRPGRWMESSPNGYESLEHLFMPMYQEVGFSNNKSRFFEGSKVKEAMQSSRRKDNQEGRESKPRKGPTIEERIQALSSFKRD